jgi:hypothetical protein
MEPGEFQDGLDPAPFAYGYQPLAWISPWVLLTFVLLVFLVAFLFHHFMRESEEKESRRQRDEIIDRIYKAINEKARTAAAAPRHQLVTAAHALWDEIHNLLGPIVALTPFGNRAVALRDALAGRPVHRPHDDDHGDGHGGDGHGGHDDGHGAASGASTVASQINIAIGGAAGSGGGHGPSGSTPSTDTVRTAVMDICDYWSRSTMKTELKAAQQALLTMPPPPPPKPRAGVGHGGH